MKTGCRILVGIFPGAEQPAQRETIRDTWLSKPSEGIECCFIEDLSFAHDGQHGATGSAGAGVRVGEPPILDVLRRLLNDYEFGYFFKCGCDSYVDLERLRNLNPDGIDLCGDVDQPDLLTLLNTTGWMASRRFLESLFRHDGGGKQSGEILFRTSKELDERLCGNKRHFPWRGNAMVAAHRLTPHHIRAVHAQNQSSHFEEIQVVHPKWSDTLNLHSSGWCCRKNGHDMGRWILDGGGRLCLTWLDWPEEQFISVNEKNGRVYRLFRGKVRTVVAVLSNGLGNQMFQYAHALRMSRRLGAQLKLRWKKSKRRQFMLGMFGLTLSTSDEPGEKIEYFGSWKEGEDPVFQKALASTHETVIVEGYFQNEHYFSDCTDEIRNLFRIEPMKGLIRDDQRCKIVGIHVRRGDFVNNPSHEICGLGYFHRAIAFVRERTEDPHFLVVSDDPVWCERNFKGYRNLEVLPIQSELETLRTLVSCQALIISNSTFSWWGAWLSKAETIVAPARFLNDREWNICPDHWHKLPTSS